MNDVDLAGNVRIRNVFAQKDMPEVTNGKTTVNVPHHDMRTFLLNAFAPLNNR